MDEESEKIPLSAMTLISKARIQMLQFYSFTVDKATTVRCRQACTSGSTTQSVSLEMVKEAKSVNGLLCASNINEEVRV